MTTLSRSQDHVKLRNLLETPGALLVGRLGTGEIAIVNKRNTRCASQHVGVSPATPFEMAEFSTAYTNAVRETDLMAVFDEKWFAVERPFTRKYNRTPHYISAGVFADGYDGWDVLKLIQNKNSWIHALKGKKILVVSPLKHSILLQYEENRNKLFPNADFPEFKSLQVVKVPLSQQPPGAPAPSKTWSQYMTELKAEIDSLDFDIALLGCGGYAMPLAHHIKVKCGKKALVIGGILQTYFGVIGKRWEDRWIKAGLEIPTEHWKRPDLNERPECWKNIENGCYW